MKNYVKTFLDNDLRAAGYKVNGADFNSLPNANPSFLDQAEDDSEYTGTYTVDVRTVTLSIEITDYVNRRALAVQLQRWFKRGNHGNLVTTCLEDGLDYLLDCVVVNLVQDRDFPQIWTAILRTGMTAWRAVDPDTDTATFTGTGGTKVITVEGTDETLLSIDLTATVGPASGYLKQNLVKMVNVPGFAYPLTAWCITLDTAALFAAGKCQADCDDIMLHLDGKIAHRWISDPNTNHTHIWFLSDLAPGYSITLATAVTDTLDRVYLQFKTDATHKKAFSTMAAIGIYYHGTEWIAYNAIDRVNCRLYLSKRGVYDTVKQTHAIGDVFSYIQHVPILYYGNVTATDPALADSSYNDTKPLKDLSGSDNTKDVRTVSTLFYDPTRPGAPDAWSLLPASKNGPNSKQYTVKGMAETGDPALGIYAAAYLKGTSWLADAITLGWQFARPGIKKVTATTRKYRSGTTWPAAAGMRRSKDGKTWYPVFNEASPTVVATPQAGTGCTALDIDPTNIITTNFVQFLFAGQSDKLANMYEWLEALTVTLEWVAATIPSITLMGEKDNFTLDVKLANDDNDDALELVFPMQLNKVISVDGEEHTVTYDGVNSHGALTLNDESRTVYIRLPLGTNHITITSPDCGTLDGDLKWYRRRL